MSIRRIKGEHNLGAITAFAEINKHLYGVSAMHVLAGNDNSIDKTEHIEVFEDLVLEWLPGGITAGGYFWRKYDSIPDNYGTFDAGIFTLAPGFYKYVAKSARFLRINPFLLNGNFSKLNGLKVIAYSGMYEKPISGIVDTVFGMSAPGNPYDLVIVSKDGSLITAKGDSGLLWRDSNGGAVGMHISGVANESDVSFSSFITRTLSPFKINSLFII